MQVRRFIDPIWKSRSLDISQLPSILSSSSKSFDFLATYLTGRVISASAELIEDANRQHQEYFVNRAVAKKRPERGEFRKSRNWHHLLDLRFNLTPRPALSICGLYDWCDQFLLVSQVKTTWMMS
jgi:hypothetical protein